MEYKHIIVETLENIGIITLNRNEVLNAVNESMLSEVAHQLGIFDTDDKIRAVILKGGEKAFAAGIDIFEIYQKQKQGGFILGEFYKSFALIEDFSKPIIVAASGYVLGIGLQLAMCGDIILAADNARFGQPEISLGTFPGFGATQKLCQTIGRAKTSEMILTGRAMNAQEANESGLISRIVPLVELDEECIRVAKQIASLPRIAIEMAKDSINHPLRQLQEPGIDYENKNLQSCLNSQDFAESLAAFIEKRSPNYKNQ